MVCELTDQSLNQNAVTVERSRFERSIVSGEAYMQQLMLCHSLLPSRGHSLQHTDMLGDAVALPCSLFVAFVDIRSGIG